MSQFCLSKADRHDKIRKTREKINGYGEKGMQRVGVMDTNKYENVQRTLFTRRKSYSQKLNHGQ